MALETEMMTETELEQAQVLEKVTEMVMGTALVMEMEMATAV